ncbi:hypothetical protein JYU34_004758 [Plutella xylostella]|uniref:Calmodulin n=2 Tax=Plutella xylostella TaxID=51655 RepID=A0ABQ7QYT9_PLUXY|nr:hypothetical protein JYU34_004758 [Plutella xylostella]
MHDKINRLPEVWKTCNKIRAAAFRVGLNLWDWYRPLDPDGNNIISESKFVSILAGPLRSVTGLSDAEIAQLADYFRTQDGRVLYHQLCSVIHGEDRATNAQASSNCLLEACPPPPPPACRSLDRWQRRRVCCLLATIGGRDVPLQPYFQDYELVAKNDGRITFAHFARILNHVGLLLAPDDFNLLVRRFIVDSYTLDYVEFLKEIEAVKKMGIAGLGPEYLHPHAVLDTTPEKLARPEIDAGLPSTALGPNDVFHPILKPKPPTRQLVEIMLRVQEFVKQRRIRISEFLREHDPLNSGRMAPENFRRALDTCGLHQVLTPDEVLCIMKHYMDPNDSRRVCWRTFEDDCDQVFTTKELEKHPDFVPGGVSELVAALPPAGSAEARGDVSEDSLDLCQAAMLRVRAACKERSIDLRPAFRDHDEHNNGHVSRAHVRRVLARLGVLPTAAQVRALEYRYLDDCGFSYLRLLEDLEERPVESAVLAGPSAVVRQSSKSRGPSPLETDIVQILAKIKGKMVREGVRPMEFLRQFDPHNELVVPRADFYRGLASAGVSLTPVEMDTLMEVFAAPARRRFIDYVRFCDTVGEALTQGGLERAPLLTPVPHIPTIDTPLNFLNFEERHIVSGAMAKLAKFPDQLSNIIEVFKDIDKQQCGSLPRVSLDRALGQRGLLPLLSARERELVYKCFGYRKGCGDEVNYRALSKALDILFATSSAPC